jgi:hypothetical protein
LHTFDVGPELGQFFIDVLVAAVDVVDAIDFGRPFGAQSGEDEGGGGAQIAGWARR